MFRSISIMLTLCLATITAQASLVYRAGGQAYYDDAQNITWVADANLSASNDFGVADIFGGFPTGQMSWAKTNEWIAAMNTANYLGVSDWRLPTTLQPDPTCQYNSSSGRNCSGSEMGHLNSVDGISTNSPTPFTNIARGDAYWSGTPVDGENNSQWGFNFRPAPTLESGTQYQLPTTRDHYFAWAVRSGDIGAQAAVPVPAAVWLFGSALGVMGVMRRKISS